MKCINYMPAKKAGSIIANAEIYFPMYHMIVKYAVVRNSKNGSWFVSPPSERYDAPDGTKKYNHLVRFTKDKNLDMCEKIRKCIEQYLMENGQKISSEESVDLNEEHHSRDPLYRKPKIQQQDSYTF